MAGRITIGLWNSYDRRRFQEPHRRALARAAGVAVGFDAALAAFGFPFEDLLAHGRVAERRGASAKGTRRGEKSDEELVGGPVTPHAVAERIAESTSIAGAEEGAARTLASEGRFLIFPEPERGFPPQLGYPVLTTSNVEPARATDAVQLATRLARGESILLIFGLGPHGPGPEARRLCKEDFDATRRGRSLETATAFGAVLAAIDSARLVAPADPDPSVPDRARAGRPPRSESERKG
ncbi:MAG: DUF531 family protein [Thermoplasmatota archaeon]